MTLNKQFEKIYLSFNQSYNTPRISRLSLLDSLKFLLDKSKTRHKAFNRISTFTCLECQDGFIWNTIEFSYIILFEWIAEVKIRCGNPNWGPKKLVPNIDGSTKLGSYWTVTLWMGGIDILSEKSIQTIRLYTVTYCKITQILHEWHISLSVHRVISPFSSWNKVKPFLYTALDRNGNI